ncbi:DNA-directed RNA polymerase III, subunit Rpc31 [Rhypophila decipiens]|uniref:DNA-directed RNA polymerase III subunit n=1 Tax=Rhypophila decipiens TaxID=261697 RepID=A0AAN6Y0V3_9PEZI|nr:DNA-directed RNA polymerase III, subunit Rpc31 [Rhypophila decipiens]
MSRGGGGGRGGRGGRGRGGFGRGGAQGNVPWALDPTLVLDGKPSDVFPFYNVPRAPQISKKQEKQIAEILLFREQLHDSPLYTQARQNRGEKLGRTYGQDQVNERYGQTSKATVNPFAAVPSYSQRFRKAERTLPDLGSRPFAEEFFPQELHATLNGDYGNPNKRRKTGVVKRLGLSNITSIKTAEELFLTEEEQTLQNKEGGLGFDKALQLIASAENEDGGMKDGDDDDDYIRDGEDEGQEEDDAYEEDYESGDDYNAEAYFGENQDDEDYDDGGDDGGDF